MPEFSATDCSLKNSPPGLSCEVRAQGSESVAKAEWALSIADGYTWPGSPRRADLNSHQLGSGTQRLGQVFFT